MVHILIVCVFVNTQAAHPYRQFTLFLPVPRLCRQVWGLYKLGEWPGCINWASFPSQLPNLLALFMVVAFGSCMDIAAIQAQYDQEVRRLASQPLNGSASPPLPPPPLGGTPSMPSTRPWNLSRRTCT